MKNNFNEKDSINEVKDTLEDFIPKIPAFSKAFLREGVWTPAVDLFEKEDKLIIKAELPGIEKDALKITIEGDVLTLRGERKTDEDVADKDYYYCERTYGSFSRSITLPASVDADKVHAVYQNGILTVELPRPIKTKEGEQEIMIQ
jgi:HSP20 family protein